MRFFKQKEIKNKITLIIILIFSVSIIAAATYAALSFKHAALKSSFETAQLIADNYSQRIKTEVYKKITIADQSNKFFLLESKPALSKDELLLFLKNNVQETDNLLKIFQAWEKPFYSTESIKVEDEDLYNKSGMFTPSVFTRDDKIFIESFKLEELESLGIKYSEIKRDKKTVISEPYLIKTSDENSMAITIIQPILYADKFYGFTGFVYNINDVESIINEPIYYSKDASLFLISHNENIIFASGKKHISGKNIEKYKGIEHQMYKILQTKGVINEYKNFSGASSDLFLNNDMMKWKLVVYLPQNIIISDFISGIYMSIFIAAVIMLSGLLILIGIINNKFKPIKSLIQNTEKMKKGFLPKIEKSDNDDELSVLNNNLEGAIKKITEAVKINKKIAQGDYSEKLKEYSIEDELSISINQIIDNAEKIERQTKEQQEITDIQIWTRKGRFEVANAQRKNPVDLKELSLNLIREIVVYSEAVMGGIYLNATDENPNIKLIATYAYGTDKQMDAEFKIGEGMIGTCAMEKKRIILDNIPEGYLTISSGLGDAPPKFLIIQPLFHNRDLIAFIEIAFISKPPDYKLEFIEQLTDNIGAWLDAALTHAKTSSLLKISQKQTFELSATETELNEKISELEKIQKEYALHSAEMESMLNAVNNTVMAVEYTPEGILLNANEMYLRIMKRDLEAVKGTNVFDLVREGEEDLRRTVEQVIQGKQVNKNVTRYTQEGEQKILSASYTPYYGKEGVVTKIIFFAFDITDLVKGKEL